MELYFKGGEHRLVPGLLNMDWSAVVSSASNELPDTALFGTLGVRKTLLKTILLQPMPVEAGKRNTE